MNDNICTNCGHDSHCEELEGRHWPNHLCNSYMGTGLAEIEYYCECEGCKCSKCDNHTITEN